MSEKLALLEEFRAACAVENSSRAERMVRLSPEMALIHTKDGRGHFVTALDIAMRAGKAELVDQLLSAGARMDLPVGAPPSATTIGQTCMTRVLSRKFADTPNYLRMVDAMIRHHAQRETERQKTPVLTALKSLADHTMQRAGIALRDAIAGDKGKLTAVMVPASTIGVTSGAMMVDKISQPAQLAAIAASALVSGGVYLAQQYARDSQHGDRLRLHQQQAIDVFDLQAGIAPKVREHRLPPLTDNVLEETETSSMAMGS